MNLFKAVKENITARQAAETYGLKVSGSGMACCPFHDDHHPSMKLDERYYCFGCQATGDAIDFVAAYLHLSPLEAAKRLAADFDIPYDANEHISAVSLNQSMKARLERKTFMDWRRKTLSDLAGYHYILEGQKKLYAPKSREEPWSERFIQSCRDQNLVELYTFFIENASEEDQRALFAERATTIDALAMRITHKTSRQHSISR